MPTIAEPSYQRGQELPDAEQQAQDSMMSAHFAPMYGPTVEGAPIVFQLEGEIRESWPSQKPRALDVTTLSPSELKRLDVAVNLLLDFLLEHRKQ
ncbi:MAG: hypothetical protein IT324_19120 [Anaerolineae bacterium]|nr:hypothetical protein [Anaerolineae bacterium]